MERRLVERERNRNVRKKRSSIILKLEGKNKTEKNYFSHFNKRDGKYKIEFVSENCTDPINMINDLILYIKTEDIDLCDDNYAFCVFDGDIEKYKQKQINECLKLAEENHIGIIFSVPSFEIWYLSHFEFTVKFHSNKDIKKYLAKKWIPGYTESMDVYNILKPKELDAINNSKKLIDHHNCLNRDKFCVDSNPCTNVYELIELLNELDSK